MKKLLPLFILIFAFSSLAQSLRAPSRWRFPTARDVKGDWLTYKKELPASYKVSGDFNNDKLIDEAWLLVPTTGKGLGLFVFLKQPDNAFRSVQLDYDGSPSPQSLYIDVASPSMDVMAKQRLSYQRRPFPLACAVEAPPHVTSTVGRFVLLKKSCLVNDDDPRYLSRS